VGESPGSASLQGVRGFVAGWRVRLKLHVPRGQRDHQDAVIEMFITSELLDLPIGGLRL
jgi:hypothetical protein